MEHNDSIRLQTEVPKCADLGPVLALKPTSARGPSYCPGLAGGGRKASILAGVEGRFTRGKVKAPGRPGSGGACRILK